MRVVQPLIRLLVLVATGAVLLTPSAGAQTLQKTAVPIDGNRNGLFERDETIQYTLTFTNSGTTDLNSVSIRDDSSACINIDISSIVITPATGSTNSSSGNSVQVELMSPLSPGETVSIQFNATATAVGACCNQATWTSVELPPSVSDRDPFDGAPDQPTCHFVSSSPGPDTDAIVDKQVLSAGCHAPGSTIEFQVRTQNTGRRPLRTAWVNDILDGRFTNVIVDGGLTYDPATRRISSDPKTYGVGEEITYTYRADLPCTAFGSLVNTAYFTYEDQDGNLYTRSDSETTTWGRPNIGDSTKTWADDPTDGDAVVSAGENVTFTIVIRNSGGCDAMNVVALDNLDPRFLSTAPALVISDGGIYDSATGQIEWNETTTPQLAAIQVGSSVTLTFTTQVDPMTPLGSVLPNTVTITPVGNNVSCPGVGAVTRTIALQNGDIIYGEAPRYVLLRNDYISCLAGAFDVIARGGPDGLPVLRPRAEPRECSNPPAINPAHPQTDIIVNPVSPYTIPFDSARGFERCPQLATGSGRVLIFYELQDECTTTLRVTKDPATSGNIIVYW